MAPLFGAIGAAASIWSDGAVEWLTPLLLQLQLRFGAAAAPPPPQTTPQANGARDSDSWRKKNARRHSTLNVTKSIIE